jgi:hypothetical protein
MTTNLTNARPGGGDARSGVGMGRSSSCRLHRPCLQRDNRAYALRRLSGLMICGDLAPTRLIKSLFPVALASS